MNLILLTIISTLIQIINCSFDESHIILSNHNLDSAGFIPAHY